ncbi:MAG: hypothetical protein EBW38_19855 [Rhodobacteraceae bacterium]|nr:hypothetical protein [Paracoccaceae bacterium]
MLVERLAAEEGEQIILNDIAEDAKSLKTAKPAAKAAPKKVEAGEAPAKKAAPKKAAPKAAAAKKPAAKKAAKKD